MVTLDASTVPGLLEAAVTAVSILGGAMAYESGLSAARAVAEEHSREVLGQRVNEGIAKGFVWGWPVSVLVFIIGLWA
jgi:hypothetical protein